MLTNLLESALRGARFNLIDIGSASIGLLLVDFTQKIGRINLSEPSQLY